MATKVTLKIPQTIDIGKVDVEFEVRDGKNLLGRMKISTGGIDWWPNNARRRRTSTWRQFADWMNTP